MPAERGYIMKKVFITLTLLFAVISQNIAVYAASGDIGYFGGITQGRRLPKTTEILLASLEKNNKTTDEDKYTYKEMIFLNGSPVEFEGILTVTQKGKVAAPSASGGSSGGGSTNVRPPKYFVGATKAFEGVTPTVLAGKYEVTYAVSGSTNAGASISRNIVFEVKWRIEGQQIIKDLDVISWRETINPGVGSALTGGAAQTYTLDSDQSYFNISIIEDHTPAVIYYRGDISQRAVYRTSESERTINEAHGSFYGYDCAWSNTETHRIDGTIYQQAQTSTASESESRGLDNTLTRSQTNTNPSYSDVWQYQYQVRPSVSVNKTMQYTENEPTAISFEGNYKEVMANESGLFYDLFVTPVQLFDVPKTGGASIPSANIFEQLIAPDLAYLKGHPAESDIKKLFAMQILEGNPKYYVPNQVITRQQYTTAVIKALKLPLASVGKNGKVMLFPDVPPNNPDFNYIMTAYVSGIAIGRSNGMFAADASIERQEALVILLRSLGLENLGLDPTPVTLFTDDAQIASWAKRELYAAERIGLIAPDEDGNINPKAQVSKAEASALINGLINYMRTELQLDYTEHIVNYTT